MSLDLLVAENVTQSDYGFAPPGGNLDILATNAAGQISNTALGGAAGATQAAPGSRFSLAGHPLMWWAVGVVGAIGLWVLFEHVGPPEERRNFANIEASFVNGFLLVAIPLVFLPMAKGILTALPIPAGAKTYFNAA